MFKNFQNFKIFKKFKVKKELFSSSVLPSQQAAGYPVRFEYKFSTGKNLSVYAIIAVKPWFTECQLDFHVRIKYLCPFVKEVVWP